MTDTDSTPVLQQTEWRFPPPQLSSCAFPPPRLSCPSPFLLPRPSTLYQLCMVVMSGVRPELSPGWAYHHSADHWVGRPAAADCWALPLSLSLSLCCCCCPELMPHCRACVSVYTLSLWINVYSTASTHKQLERPLCPSAFKCFFF